MASNKDLQLGPTGMPGSSIQEELLKDVEAGLKDSKGIPNGPRVVANGLAVVTNGPESVANGGKSVANGQEGALKDSEDDRKDPDIMKQNLIKDLQQFSKDQEPESSCTIFKVGERERKVNPQHFDSELISLGLYKRKVEDWGTSKESKSKGDTFRLKIVAALLRDLNLRKVDTAAWDDICNNIVEEPQKMQELYDHDREDVRMPEKVVQQVLTYDALFLACCLGTCFDGIFSRMFPDVSSVFMRKSKTFRKSLFIDIIKLENQIPLSLIRKALEYVIELRYKLQKDLIANKDGTVIKEDTLHSICTGLAGQYSCTLPFPVSTNYQTERGEQTHLLGCLYSAAFLGLKKNKQKEEAHKAKKDDAARSGQGQGHEDLERASDLPNDLVSSNIRTSWKHKNSISHVLSMSMKRKNSAQASSNGPPIHSATQLYEAGIECKGHEKEGGVGAGDFKDVEFRQSTFGATLYLPVIHYIKSDSEPLWRNLVAYEDEKIKLDDDHEFAAYLELMDQLIDTENDVSLLRKGTSPVIIANGLGSDKAVADVFNSMLANYDINLTPSHQWHSVRKEIHGFCSANRNHIRIYLKRKCIKFTRTYFSTPWLFISIGTASALLSLTCLQTVYTILSYLGGSNLH